MKGLIRYLTPTLMVILLVCGGCSPAESPEEVDSTPSAGISTRAIGSVEVTNYPLSYVVGRIAGPLLEVRFRAAEAPDPAYWRPAADEVVDMQGADLILLNGASYEGWLKDVSLPTSRLVNTTAGVRDRLIALGSELTHSHGTEGEHEHEGTAFTTWLDPTLLIEQARAVAEACARQWPGQAATFAEGLAALVADLETLDAELRSATANAADHPVIFSHPVYQYLQQRYGVLGESVHWEPDQAPDESRWTELEHLIAVNRVEWMVWEGEPLAATSRRLLELGLHWVVIDPCSTPPEEGDLLTAMRHNAEALQKVFGPSP